MKLSSRMPMLVIAALGLTGAVTLQAQDRPVSSNHDRPTASTAAAPNPATRSPATMTDVPLAKGKSSFTMDQARRRLEQAGYTQITQMTQDKDGLWQARAMHDGRPVNAALDYKGNVAARQNAG